MPSLKLALWFWRWRFFKFHWCIFTLLLLYPLEKGHGPSFVQTWIPLNQGWFVPSLVKIDPMVLEKMNIWKFYSQTDRLTDDERQVIRKTRLNIQLRSAKEITSVICNLRYVSVSLQFIRNVLIRLYLFLFTRTICKKEAEIRIHDKKEQRIKTGYIFYIHN